MRLVFIVFFTVLILIVALVYATTFFTWDMDTRNLLFLNVKLGTVSWWPLALALIFAVGVSIVRHTLTAWSTASSPLWFQRLFGWAFVITGLLAGVTAITQKDISIQTRSAQVEALENGKWQVVGQAALEKVVQQNTRYHLAFILPGLMIWLGIVGGSYQNDKGVTNSPGSSHVPSDTNTPPPL